MQRAAVYRRYIDRLIFNYRLYSTLAAVGMDWGVGGGSRQQTGAALKPWGKEAARVRAVAAVIAAMSVFCPALHAGDRPIELIEIDFTPPPPQRDRLFFFSGGDIARGSRFVWAGLVAAPLGYLRDDGLRIRVVGGGGRYRYRTSAVPGGINDALLVSGEILLGYRHAIGSTAITAYLGAHVESQLLAEFDPGHRAQGVATGIKAAAELYTRLSPDAFAAVSVAASTVHAKYQARGAIGREYPKGFCARRRDGGARRRSLRGAARRHVAYFTYKRTVFTLSGGYLSNSDKGGSPYATLSVYAPY